MRNRIEDIFLERIREIDVCLDNECYIAALSLALTLPDICGRAEYPNARVRDRYIMWYDTFLGPLQKFNSPYGADMPYLSGEVVYSLRCNFLHIGNPNIEIDKIKDELCKIDHFSLEAGQSLSGDLSHVTYGKGFCITERSYSVNIRLLCVRLSRIAKEYYIEHKGKFDFFKYSMVKMDEA